MSQNPKFYFLQSRNPDSARHRNLDSGGNWYNSGMSFTMSEVQTHLEAGTGLRVLVVNSDQESAKPRGVNPGKIRIRRDVEEVEISETSALTRQRVTASLVVTYAFQTTRSLANDEEFVAARNKVRARLVGWDANGKLADCFNLISSRQADEDADGLEGWIETYSGDYFLESV